MFSKIDVNGPNTHPVWKFLKSKMDVGEIGWNFEKFLVNQDGKPVRRYSPKFETINVAEDIEALLKNGPNALD